MSPRPYQAGEQRRAATEATRSRIVEAARDLLADPEATAFSIDAVAQRADVARMTVYYQFKSKGKLLEALFDDFAARANMRAMQNVFRESDAHLALGLLVDVFCNLWKSQGPIVRRLNAMAVLDPEVDRALQERSSWRRDAIAQLVARVRRGRKAGELVDVVNVLTSFETYDALSARHGLKEVAAILRHTVAALVSAS
ncbi:MAG TPA: TetR/AcrR family transcriptional regulator [Candidatus Dormibacteraeota bacterium]|nr:TetR/AcrR family transcriptional regulator [Candidatus Dormibacteraeota bacterium]